MVVLIGCTYVPLSSGVGVGEPMVLGPQLINNETNNPIVRTTTNVITHMNVEQSICSIRLGVEREASLVGIGVDLLLDCFGLWRLSHFLSLFLLYFLYRHYTNHSLGLQEKSRNFCVKKF
jgi:hypothetical protein